MEDFIIHASQSPLTAALLTVVFFCVCCRQFLRALIQPLPVINQTGFARSALRVEKTYKVFAWGTLMASFLLGLVMSFAEVFARL